MSLSHVDPTKRLIYFSSIPEVVIVHRQAHLLSRQLDADAGNMVLRKIQAMGVEVLTGRSPTVQLDRRADDDPAQDVFTGLGFADGTILQADLVIYAIGIQPRDEIAQSSGIKCDAKGGIVVQDNLQTSAGDVYAIGECASWKGNTYGLIGPGSECLRIFVMASGG